MTTGRYIVNTHIMTKIEKKLNINASKERVWDTIADLGEI